MNSQGNLGYLFICIGLIIIVSFKKLLKSYKSLRLGLFITYYMIRNPSILKARSRIPIVNLLGRVSPAAKPGPGLEGEKNIRPLPPTERRHLAECDQV